MSATIFGKVIRPIGFREIDIVALINSRRFNKTKQNSAHTGFIDDFVKHATTNVFLGFGCHFRNTNLKVSDFGVFCAGHIPLDLLILLVAVLV